MWNSFLDWLDFCPGSLPEISKLLISTSGIVAGKMSFCHVSKKYDHICPDHKLWPKPKDHIDFLNECAQISLEFIQCTEMGDFGRFLLVTLSSRRTKMSTYLCFM